MTSPPILLSLIPFSPSSSRTYALSGRDSTPSPRLPQRSLALFDCSSGKTSRLLPALNLFRLWFFRRFNRRRSRRIFLTCMPFWLFFSRRYPPFSFSGSSKVRVFLFCYILLSNPSPPNSSSGLIWRTRLLSTLW